MFSFWCKAILVTKYRVFTGASPGGANICCDKHKPNACAKFRNGSALHRHNAVFRQVWCSWCIACTSERCRPYRLQGKTHMDPYIHIYLSIHLYSHIHFAQFILFYNDLMSFPETKLFSNAQQVLSKSQRQRICEDISAMRIACFTFQFNAISHLEQ